MEFTSQASNAALFHIRSMLMRLPPPDWIQHQVSATQQHAGGCAMANSPSQPDGRSWGCKDILLEATGTCRLKALHCVPCCVCLVWLQVNSDPVACLLLAASNDSCSSVSDFAGCCRLGMILLLTRCCPSWS